MGAVRNEDLVFGLTPTAVIRLDEPQTGPLAMRARRRLQRHSIHPGQGQQRALQLPHQAQRALGATLRVVGMKVGKIIQPRQCLVDRRVVFHGARPERINALVQIEIHPTEAAEVARQLRLTDGWNGQR